MPALLTLDRLAATTPDGTPLFSDLTLALDRERVGLVGRNGAGKSTLLAIIAGDQAPAGGTVHRPARVGRLRQIMPEAGTIGDALGLGAALARLDRIEAGAGDEADFAEADWTLRERLAAALAATGLGAMPLDRAVAGLSGGERTRVGLAAMLIDEPELLLLDEPTNNLDAEGRRAVAELLAGWTGGALVASHDRALLEAMDRIVQLGSTGAVVFAGGWSAFAEARDAARDAAQGALDRERRALDRTRRAIQQQAERRARRDKAGRRAAARGGEPRILLGMKARAAEESAGRERRIGERLRDEARERLAEARGRVEIVAPLHIDLPETGLPANRTVLRFEDVVLERGGRRLFGPLDLAITGPRRIAVTGPNGSGKTSLLALAAGALEPSAGRVHRQGRAVLLDQHATLPDPARDLVGNMRLRHPGMTEREAHDVLARFAFRARDARKPAGALSGGERLRAALALAVAGPAAPGLLILDEPTNHLDMDAIETLEAALAGHDGALLVVSHDPGFLDAIGVEESIALG